MIPYRVSNSYWLPCTTQKVLVHSKYYKLLQYQSSKALLPLSQCSLKNLKNTVFFKKKTNILQEWTCKKIGLYIQKIVV